MYSLDTQPAELTDVEWPDASIALQVVVPGDVAPVDAISVVLHSNGRNWLSKERFDISGSLRGWRPINQASYWPVQSLSIAGRIPKRISTIGLFDRVKGGSSQHINISVGRVGKNFFPKSDHFMWPGPLKKQGLFDGDVGFPQPKTKKKGLGSFRLTGTIRIGERHIQLPRLGKLRLKERGYLPVDGTLEVKVLSATVSEKAGRWFVAVQVEQTLPDPAPSDRPVAGVDLGLLALATVSDGTVIANPRPLKTALRQVKRLQRRVSRRQKGGANRKKAREQLARTHARVANIRRETLHQATTKLTKTKSVIVVEDLNVSGMQKNRKLAAAIADVGWSEFKRQLTYKAAWRGGQVVLADRFYPSSKLCHVCGNKLVDLALDVRRWTCSACGADHDRDLNAAKNLEQWVTRKRTASSRGMHAAGSDACGAEKSMTGHGARQVLRVEAGTDVRLALR